MNYKMKNRAMPKTDKTPSERYHEMPEDLLNLIMRMRAAQMVCELLHRYPEESEPESDDKKIVMVLRPGKEPKVLTCGEPVPESQRAALRFFELARFMALQRSGAGRDL